MCYSPERLWAGVPAIQDALSCMRFVCCQPPSSSHPSCSSVACVMGWFLTVPSARPLHIPPSRWVVCGVEEYPGWTPWMRLPPTISSCLHLRSDCPSFTALWAARQCWLPAPSLLSRLIRVPQFQGCPLFPPLPLPNSVNPSFLGRICKVWWFPHQPAPCRVIESMVWVGP